MFAIILNSDYVVGILPGYTDQVRIVKDFIVVESLPTIFPVPNGYRAKRIDGEFVLEEIPKPLVPEAEPSPEQIQIDALNDIAAQLLLDSANKDAMISQQSDMIAGLMMTVAQLQGGV